MKQKKRRYDEEFKQRAVRLSYSADRSVKSVTEALGITSAMLYRWRKDYTPEGNKTEAAEQHDEMRALRARIAELEEENYIFKKTSAYFAKHQR